MRCPTCKRPMTALFTSYVCDWCDGLKKPKPVARGWVLWHDEGKSGRELYVFPTREMAEYYRRATGSEGEVREVLSEFPIQWHSGKGTIQNLRLADRLFTVFPDYRFEPAPYRAYLAPRDPER